MNPLIPTRPLVYSIMGCSCLLKGKKVCISSVLFFHECCCCVFCDQIASLLHHISLVLRSCSFFCVLQCLALPYCGLFQCFQSFHCDFNVLGLLADIAPWFLLWFGHNIRIVSLCFVALSKWVMQNCCQEGAIVYLYLYLPCNASVIISRA